MVLVGIDAFGSAEAAGPGGPILIPRLSGAMHDPFLRDAVMMHLLGAPQAQLSSVLDMTYGLGPDQAFGDDLDAHWNGLDADRDGPEEDRDPHFRELLTQHPDLERLSAGQAVLAAAARAAVSGDRAPSLAVMALLAWHQGRTGRSRLLAERARADDPTLSLTALVEALLVRRVPPLWAQIRP
jgi:hypothetical protein